MTSNPEPQTMKLTRFENIDVCRSVRRRAYGERDQGVNLKGYRDLEVYRSSFEMALEIFEETKSLPKEEKYSLIDQIRRSSRSIASNIAKAWGKHMYRNHFIGKLSVAMLKPMKPRPALLNKAVEFLRV